MALPGGDSDPTNRGGPGPTFNSVQDAVSTIGARNYYGDPYTDAQWQQVLGAAGQPSAPGPAPDGGIGSISSGLTGGGGPNVNPITSGAAGASLSGGAANTGVLPSNGQLFGPGSPLPPSGGSAVFTGGNNPGAHSVVGDPVTLDNYRNAVFDGHNLGGWSNLGTISGMAAPPQDFGTPSLYGWQNFSPGAQQQAGFYGDLAKWSQFQQAPELQRTSIDWTGYGSGQGPAPGPQGPSPQGYPGPFPVPGAPGAPGGAAPSAPPTGGQPAPNAGAPQLQPPPPAPTSGGFSAGSGPSAMPPPAPAPSAPTTIGAGGFSSGSGPSGNIGNLGGPTGGGMSHMTATNQTGDPTPNIGTPAQQFKQSLQGAPITGGQPNIQTIGAAGGTPNIGTPVQQFRQSPSGQITGGGGPTGQPSPPYGSGQGQFGKSPTGAPMQMGPGGIPAVGQFANPVFQQQQQTRDQQQGLIGRLGSDLNGAQPSAAQAQLAQGTTNAINSQASMAASAGPGNYGLAARTAMQNAAGISSDASNKSAILRAQEYAQTRQELGSALNSSRVQDLQATGMSYDNAVKQAQLEQQQNLSQAQLQQQQNQLNGSLAAQYYGLGNTVQSNDLASRMHYMDLMAQKYANDRGLAQNQSQFNTQQSNLQVGTALSAGAAGLGALVALSDERTKTDIADAKPGELSEFLGKIKPSTFRYKDSRHGEGQHTGVIAQDVAKSTIGAGLIVDTPAGKAIHVPKTTMASLAALALHERRLKKLESELTRRDATPRTIGAPARAA